VNDAIRTLPVFDVLVDFDQIVRSPNSPAQWRDGLSNDGLHPNVAGARLMVSRFRCICFLRAAIT
jgi:hypothetical protein